MSTVDIAVLLVCALAIVVSLHAMRLARRAALPVQVPARAALHDFTGPWVPVEEDGIPEQWQRADATCTRCGETRRVWLGVTPDQLEGTGAPCSGPTSPVRRWWDHIRP